MTATWAPTALVGVMVTAALLVMLNDWRSLLTGLAIQYLLAAVLAGQVITGPLAAVRLLTGWLAVSILALTAWRLRLPAGAAGVWRPAQLVFPTGFLFRLLATLAVASVALTLGGRLEFLLPGLDPAVNTAVITLAGLGLLNLGLTEEPVNAGCGLLTALTGFELAYAAIEPSLAVAALLAAVHFSIAMAVSYLAVMRYGPGEAG